MLQGAQVIVLATPVFLGLIALECLVGWRRGRNTYRVNDALNSIGLGILSQLTGVFGQLVMLGIYTLAWQHLALFELSASAWWVWLAGLVLYDFLYYWNHRLGHTVAVLWAAHVVHHQSEDYNLSTALRQPSSYFLLSWIFYLPMAVLGFPPLVYAVVGLVDLLYQYWVHTQQIGRLGWFDRWFCAPSNHRVHHAVNDRYLDRNYGGILLVWDRLFGSWEPEHDDEPCVYGTRSPLRSWNPLWANLEVYAALAHDSWHARSWADKLRVWLKPPGWRPADVVERFPKPPFDIERVRHGRYDPPLTPARQWAAIALFVLLLSGALGFLWVAHTLAWTAQLACVAALAAGLWIVGRLCTPRGPSETRPLPLAALSPSKRD
ncbi:sterol desaturase family protein [Caldimonas sp. KR1-144]|uniref:sterol desaturase family protein n=1 Tax=Caldimonas sp. KR1-144 TaxID=3400911 RepID=UPI003C0010C9